MIPACPSRSRLEYHGSSSFPQNSSRLFATFSSGPAIARCGSAIAVADSRDRKGNQCRILAWRRRAQGISAWEVRPLAIEYTEG
jgi:hypothetical protein